MYYWLSVAVIPVSLLYGRDLKWLGECSSASITTTTSGEQTKFGTRMRLRDLT
jgi:hypothetical protein